MTRIVGVLLLVNAYLFTSPFIFVNVPVGPLALLLNVMLAGFLYYTNSGIEKKYILFMISILVGYCISSLYWQDYGLIHYSKFLLLAFIIVPLLNQKQKNSFTSLSSYYLLLQVSFAIVGFLYAFSGGGAIFELVSSSGRVYKLFLTTISVTGYSNFIRPSGFFDEPGALSFAICSVVLLRNIYGFDKKVSYYLLIGGLVTLSLAHFIFLMFYVAYDLFLNRSRSVLLLIMGIFAMPVIFAVFFDGYEVVANYYFSRTANGLSGDGRSTLLYNAIEYLEASPSLTYLFGIDSNCLTDFTNNCRFIYPRMGENFLSPLVFGGFITSWPYYFVIMLCTIYLLRSPKTFILYFAFFILFLQRPYIFNYSYSFLWVLALVEMISHNKNHGK
ncbi:hypothetical protein BCS98_15300 [Vibrio breoganii]|uniref:hypothetical protein n=1 Tax=Vibrio breoganii TaxID=553239 RepID=UPI000C846E42|nr:hypothetical protein [Vibrio breoganii]PMO90158.1 hypothetical protein BCS98_15300 [Vibrio breoganii]